MSNKEMDKLFENSKFLKSDIEIKFLPRKKGLGCNDRVIVLNPSVVKGIKENIKNIKKRLKKTEKNNLKDESSVSEEECGRTSMFKKK